MGRKKVHDEEAQPTAAESPKIKAKSVKPTVINLCGQKVTVDRSAGVVGILLLLALVFFLVQDSSSPEPLSTESTAAAAAPAPAAPPAAAASSNIPGSPTALPPIPPSESCTAQEIQKQISGFAPIKGRVWYWGCSPDSWWEMVYKHSPTSSGKIFVDIGMNKGYMGGAWYALWNPQLKLNPNTLGNAVRKVPPIGDQDCGACGDCNDKVSPGSVANPTKDALIKVHGFDGAQVTVQKHHKIVRDFFPLVEGYWTSSNNAVSDHEGTIDFPNVLSEVASIHTNTGLSAAHKDKIFADDKKITVNMTTVDSFMKQWQVDKLFTLKIDTEGNDASVLKGAIDTLKNHRTHIVQFEYHNLGLWASEENLKDHVDRLDDYGYTCFLLAHECTHILTKCWDPIFEFRTWSNVMCVSRIHEPKLIQSLTAKSYAKQAAAACPMPK